MYFENLGRSPTAQALDVGPVCEENIIYFAKRVKRFHVCDLFMRLNRNRPKGLSTEKIREYLDYAPGSFDGINAFSTRMDEPTKASRPFDRDRDGLVPSGGAATLIIESYESAKKRGTPILGEILGYGFSSNGDHISIPTLNGLVVSVERALKDASLAPKNIDYINAHATSTPVGDKTEAQSIESIFGGLKTPVSSTKSLTGHEMWMGGASEIIYSLLMAQNSFIAPNLNFDNPDEDSAKLNIIPETKEQKLDIILSNAFGFGGTNSTLIVKKL